MCSNPPQLPHPPISNRELPTADGPWVCLPLKLQHDKKWLICSRRAVSDSIRLGFVEDAELVKRRLSALPELIGDWAARREFVERGRINQPG